jgi:hypothetical protein
MAIIEIKVKVFEKLTKEGKKFNTFKAVLKNGAFMDLKFRKEVTRLPKTDSILLVEDTDMNVDENRLYPCVWVSDVKEIKAYEVEKKLDPKVKALFIDNSDKNDVTGKPLPF